MTKWSKDKVDSDPRAPLRAVTVWILNRDHAVLGRLAKKRHISMSALARLAVLQFLNVSTQTVTSRDEIKGELNGSS
jgi:hypothetical protein